MESGGRKTKERREGVAIYGISYRMCLSPPTGVLFSESPTPQKLFPSLFVVTYVITLLL